MAADTIIHRLFERADSNGDDPAYFAKENGSYVSTSYRSFAAEVRLAAKAMVALGLGVEDRVCILGFNRPEWAIFDLAAMAAGGCPAGIYTTNSPDEVRYIVDHSESPLLLIEDLGQWAKVNEVREQLPKLRHVILMKGVKVDDPLAMTWDEFLAHGEGVDDSALDARVDALRPDQMATFIYTSGTTGPPKAVMLSHDNLSWTAKCAVDLVGMTRDDFSVSYLPLSHIAEQMFTLHAPITGGGHVYYAESIDKLPDNLKEVQPTIVFGVPRIWEKFHAGVSAKMAEATGLRKRILDFALATGHAVRAVENRGEKLDPIMRLRRKIANRLIFSKVKPAIGLARARICVSGAAPIQPEILEFFSGLDLSIYEVYGQSEGSGPTSFNYPGHCKYGTVGPALPGVDVKIADDGEIVFKGRNVFLGYFKDEAATAETLVDGWLHSGDLGSFDKDGYLSITGRKKEIIITAGGKNIAPKNIEAAMKNHELVAECVVIGDRRKFLSALVTLDEEAVARFKEQHGLSGAIHDSAEVRAEIDKAVEATNAQFARVEHIRKYTVLPRNFTVEDGELTPTLKIKRRIIHDHFADEIEAMYAE
ncbi:MAG: long-chain fatty acid--CoA ligase [Deltaproteobacteria bacterium]|nr:MAG: long-chain fatty acid--CoA ligase [Deltaproteobacteria bacterium]